MCVEPVRSVFWSSGFWSRCPPRGRRASADEGPSVVVQRLSHCAHCKHPGNGNCYTAYIHCNCRTTWIIGFAGPIKINQNHLSLGYFRGLWKRSVSVVFGLFSRTSIVFLSAAATVHQQHGIQKQQIRAMLNL